MLIVIGTVVGIVLSIVPYWILWKRTGHSGAWSLFLLLPVTGIVSYWILAFKEWPSDETDKDAADVF
ncbi:hypothetical protein [Pseudaestuariivita rosea]|uniref:hypothetical protein n=1 Tax=Pseudaestuariivita rosea TaxID=2763263 RepID=UPI001ABB9F77|nr:hypothetical protein [Pseudaestuariivita rosea]